MFKSLKDFDFTKFDQNVNYVLLCDTDIFQYYERCTIKTTIQEWKKLLSQYKSVRYFLDDGDVRFDCIRKNNHVDIFSIRVDNPKIKDRSYDNIYNETEKLGYLFDS